MTAARGERTHLIVVDEAVVHERLPLALALPTETWTVYRCPWCSTKKRHVDRMAVHLYDEHVPQMNEAELASLEDHLAGLRHG